MALDNPFHKHLPLGKILTVGTFFLVVALAGIATIVYLQYTETQKAIGNTMSAASTRSLIAHMEHEMTALLLSGGDARSHTRIEDDVEEFERAIDKLEAQQQRAWFLSAPVTPGMVATLGKVRSDWVEVARIFNNLLKNDAIWQQLDMIRSTADARSSDAWVATQIELMTIKDNLTKPLEQLLQQTAQLTEEYTATPINHWVLVVIGVLILLIIVALAVMITMVVRDLRGREEAAEFDAKRNQEAILKLLEETTKMADGDITVRATVDEAITGAIADALNFTLEEMSALIRRINRTADQVTHETEGVQEISEKLFIASQQQSREIEQTANTVLQVTQSISEVAEAAAQSANVAQQSLDAAGKGATAVRSQINSMTEIRTQIQETAKRIKRLGDSSLEIGEIVSMISDITDQTNVLALNAAIQAASAGEAGRGFAVVAEEVQRLAERSGEATKQIAAIVKTIQSDTQDAVSAMERSTSGVVEGTRLSEEAGDALADVERVSNRLAELIRNISRQTQAQSMSVDEVRADISKILKTTEAATKGTEQTTTSISRLTQAAAELRAAVSGFKV